MPTPTPNAYSYASNDVPVRRSRGSTYMRTRHFAPAVTIALAISAQASPTILYEYSTQTIQQHVVVRDISGIVELSSIEAGCSPTMVGGLIESVEYAKDDQDTPMRFDSEHGMDLSNGLA